MQISSKYMKRHPEQAKLYPKYNAKQFRVRSKKDLLNSSASKPGQANGLPNIGTFDIHTQLFYRPERAASNVWSFPSDQRPAGKERRWPWSWLQDQDQAEAEQLGC